jgi:hypothetical protein
MYMATQAQRPLHELREWHRWSRWRWRGDLVTSGMSMAACTANDLRVSKDLVYGMLDLLL